jgi:hypothetical protein
MSDIYYWVGVTTVTLSALLGMSFLIMYAGNVIHKNTAWIKQVFYYWMNKAEFERWKNSKRGDK